MIEKYHQKIIVRLQLILLTFLDLLCSKKFWAAVGGGYAAFEATGDPWVILWATLGYVLSQGLADFGKERSS